MWATRHEAVNVSTTLFGVASTSELRKGGYGMFRWFPGLFLPPGFCSRMGLVEMLCQNVRFERASCTKCSLAGVVPVPVLKSFRLAHACGSAHKRFVINMDGTNVDVEIASLCKAFATIWLGANERLSVVDGHACVVDVDVFLELAY